MKEALKNEILEVIDKYANLHTDDMTGAEVREFCNALRDYVAWQDDNVKAYEKEIVPELKGKIETVTEEKSNLTDENNKLNETVRILEGQLKESKDSSDYWLKENGKTYEQLKNLKKDFSAIAQLMTTLISR